MNDLPHGINIEDLKELEKLDSNIQVSGDITYEEYLWIVKYILRRRRRAAATGLVSSIVLTPSVLVVPAGSPVGTVVGTLSVSGGFATYTYSFLSNPGGYFTIVGNQIQVGATLPSPQVIPVQIQATNGLGDNPTITTTITIQPTGVHPTYFIYGF